MQTNDSLNFSGSTQLSGKLYIVATPIGNLSDISLRAIETLKQVDTIFAEDTRQSMKLLQHYSITTAVRSLHQHNENQRIDEIIKKLQSGANLALISDAGTPLISDPGYQLIKQVRQQDIAVVPIPGACAFVAALSSAGLATDHFYFHGFLPARTQKRCDVLRQLLSRSETLIFYESCHRIVDTLRDMRSILPQQCRGVVARELTKKFESFYTGTLDSLIAQIDDNPKNQKGEFVILIELPRVKDEKWQDATQLVLKLLPYMPVKLASEIASDTFGANKNKLYQFAIDSDNKGAS